MSLSSRMVIVLTAVGLLSGGFLASVGMLTKERIAFNKQMEIAIVKRLGISAPKNPNCIPQIARAKLVC